MEAFTQAMVTWLQGAFHNNYLVTIFLSIFPMIEVRGAITVATSLGMNPWVAYALSCCSALLICPLLLIFLRPILRGLKKTKLFRSIATAVEEIFLSKAKKIEEDAAEEAVSDKEGRAFMQSDSPEDKIKLGKKKKWSKILGVFLFVAVPLPMTGVWTGSAVAAFMNLEYRYSVPAIVVGNFVAGLIITVLNIVLGKYSSLILLVLALFVFLTIMGLIVTFIVKYKKLKKKKAAAKTE